MKRFFESLLLAFGLIGLALPVSGCVVDADGPGEEIGEELDEGFEIEGRGLED
ncbi:MAG: hypothetical protein KY476_23355 [Planctomycetes bacterium]|nr:hypothetical protein [Planctomycetota bacterium]